MLISPNVRKVMWTLHVTASVGWLGALLVFLAHAMVNLSSANEQTILPQWVKFALLAMVGLAAVLLAMLLAGHHGPSAHR